MNFDEFHGHTMSPVHVACSSGNVDELRRLLGENRAVDCRDNRGWIALHHAAAGNHVECLKLLLKKSKSELEHETFMGFTPLMIAAQERSLQCVSELLHNYQPNEHDVNKRNMEWGTALTLATDSTLCVPNELPLSNQTCSDGYNVCKLLIEHGAEVNVREFEGDHSMLLDAARSESKWAPRLIELLLPLTIYDEQVERKANMSPLQHAIMSGRIDNVHCMLKFVNNSPFVMPNKEFMWKRLGTKIVLVSNLSLLFCSLSNETKSEELSNLTAKMIHLGWDVNAHGVVRSPLAVLAFEFVKFRHNRDSNSKKECLEKLANLLLAKKAKLWPIEAEEVVKETLQHHHDNVHCLIELINLGIIPAESLLHVVGEKSFSDDISFHLHSSSLSLIGLILTESFGHQGKLVTLIDGLLEKRASSESDDEARSPQHLAFVKSKLQLATLKKLTRTAIRQQLICNGHLQPWQMIKALQPHLPMKTLSNYVVNFQLSLWTERY